MPSPKATFIGLIQYIEPVLGTGVNSTGVHI